MKLWESVKQFKSNANGHGVLIKCCKLLNFKCNCWTLTGLHDYEDFLKINQSELNTYFMVECKNEIEKNSKNSFSMGRSMVNVLSGKG